MSGLHKTHTLFPPPGFVGWVHMALTAARCRSDTCLPRTFQGGAHRGQGAWLSPIQSVPVVGTVRVWPKVGLFMVLFSVKCLC